MISVFVHSADPGDIQNWRWKVNSDDESDFGSEPKKYLLNSDPKFIAYVRKSPIPSIVLSPDDVDVSPFIDSITCGNEDFESRVSKMHAFNLALRRKIEICDELAQFKDAPICVFIHFGDNSYKQANERLGLAWKALDNRAKQNFLCMAISRNGTSINQSWLLARKNVGGNILLLPSSLQEVLDVLEEGCKGWCVEVPESFKTAKLATSTFGTNRSSVGNVVHLVESTTGNTISSADTATQSASNGSKFATLPLRIKHVLELIVLLELVCGFVLAWMKSFQGRSFATELGFGVLGLVFVVIQFGILFSFHEEGTGSGDHTMNHSRASDSDTD